MMSDIQRYGDPSRDYMIPAHDDGFVVLYAGHAAAVAAARAEEALSREFFHAEGYAQGQRDERERIVAALEAVYRYGRDRDPSAFELEVYEFIQTAIKGDN